MMQGKDALLVNWFIRERIKDIRNLARTMSALGPHLWVKLLFFVLLTAFSTQSSAQTGFENNSLPHQDFLESYRTAFQAHELKKFDQACKLFIEVSQKSEFALQVLAELHALENCTRAGTPTDPILLKKGSDQSPPPWLKIFSVQVRLEAALASKDQLSILELSVERSKLALPQTERIQLMEQAIEARKKMKSHKKWTLVRLKKRLYKIAPRLTPSPRRSQFLKVAYDARRAREFKKAEKFYQKVLRSKSSSQKLKLKALRGLGLSYKQQRNKASYLQIQKDLAGVLYRNWKKNKKSRRHKKKYHDQAMVYARTLWTQSQISKARRVLKQTERRLKGHYTLAEIYWIYGRMAEEKGQFQSANFHFRRALRQKQRNRELKEKILWYEAWNSFKLKDWEKSKASLEKLIQETENDFAKAKYSYWRGEILEQMGQKSLSRKSFEDLAKEDSLGFYGLLSYRKIGKKIPSLNTKRQPSQNQPPNDFYDRILFESLLFVGENEIAADYLKFATRRFMKNPGSDNDQIVFVFKQFARTGSYLSLFQSLGGLRAEKRQSILDRYPDLLFPRPFLEIVDQAARRHQVPEEMIYSIMRQESAFNKRARSPADAFGLMQLIPRVARKEAKGQGVTFREAEDLYQPKINVPLGAIHLQGLLKKYENKVILAAAAYNAGPRAIQGWLKSRYKGETLTFIEDIPYEETRGYIRLIIRNMIFYSVVKNNWRPIDFPEDYLRL